MNDFRLNWQQPLPQLGELVRPEPPMTPAQRLRDERAEFEIQDCEAIVKDDIGYIVTEDDCRQVKTRPLGPISLGHVKVGDTIRITASGVIASGTQSYVFTYDLPAPVAPSAPQGEWVMTCDQRPPKVGAYAVMFSDGAVYRGEAASYWDGDAWHLYPDPSSRLLLAQESVRWLAP